MAGPIRRSSAVALVCALVALSCTQQPVGSPSPAATTAAAATATPGPVAATEPCAAGGLPLSAIRSAAPTVAPSPASPTPRPATAPTATPTPRPAPTADRVGFPEGYQTAFRFGYVYDRKDVKSISYICLNERAASAKQGEAFPFGSVIVCSSTRKALRS